MTAPQSTQPQGEGPVLTVELSLDRFAREALEGQCAEFGVSKQEFVRFALLYYLADLDSGRISRRIPSAPVAQGTRE